MPLFAWITVRCPGCVVSAALGIALLVGTPAWSQLAEPVRVADPAAGLKLEVSSELSAEDGMIVDSATHGLSLESLESMALLGNPSIQRAAALVRAARGAAVQAGLQPNPLVGIDFQQLGSDGRAEQYGVGFAQEIVQPRKLKLDRSIALHEANRRTQELIATRYRVLTDVRLAYVRALRAERQLKLTRELVEISEKGLAVASQLLRAGEISRGEVLQAEIEVETANILNQNALNERLAVWRALGAVVGQGPMTPQAISGDLEEAPQGLIFGESLSQLQSQSPEIASVLAKIDRARCRLQRELIEVQPNVTVEGLLNWRDNGIDGDADAGLVVALPVPIWNRNQGAICEARAELAAAQRELAQVELSLSQRLAPVFERYSNAAAQVSRYRNRILPRAAQTLELTRQSFEQGEVSFINLLAVQRTFANNQLAYLDALESVRLAEIEIAGLLLSGSLED